MTEIYKAFQNQHFWQAYENLDYRNRAKGNTDWLNEFAQHFTIETKHIQHITPAEQVRDVHLNGLVVNALDSELDPCADNYHDLYDLRFKELKNQLSSLPENHLQHFKDDLLEYEKTMLLFEFPLPKNYALRLSLDIDTNEYLIPDQTLYLLKGEQAFQLGFWDSAHWHPYCLCLEEINLLECYWKEQESIWKKQSSIAWALLAKFVGIDKKDDHTLLSDKYINILKELDVESEETFHLHKDCSWQKTVKGHEFLGVKVPKHLNYLNLESKVIKMMSYSLRKQNYDELDEQVDFPFEDWEQVMALVEGRVGEK